MRRNWIPLMLLSCTLSGCATTPAVSGEPATTPSLTQDDLLRRSEALTDALVRNDALGIGRFLSQEFSCEVAGDPMEFAMVRHQFRANACTALGIPVQRQMRRGVTKSEAAPRRVEPGPVEVSIEGDTATISGLQTYFNWFPADGDGVRVARVTDTWRAESGTWKLLRRVSAPAGN